MTRDPGTLIAYAALSVWAIATAVVGLLFHFGNVPGRFQPWMFPMCMAMFAGGLDL